MKGFFIDTADISQIQGVLDKCTEHNISLNPYTFRGVTTNPNAMAKIDKYHFKDWIKHVDSINMFLSDYFGYMHSREIHVQVPNSQTLNKSDIFYFIDAILLECESDYVNLGIKISPMYLKLVSDIRDEYEGRVKVNVTGLADAVNVFRALSYGVDYASIIPGRMEERSVNANEHLELLATRGVAGTSEVITGSMRTLKGLYNAFKYNTVPTIGMRVWDQIFESDRTTSKFAKEIVSVSNIISIRENASVEIPSTCIDLTREFFEQMDELGKQCTHDVINRL